MWVATSLIVYVFCKHISLTAALKLFKIYSGEGCGVTEPFRILTHPVTDGSAAKCSILESFLNQLTEIELEYVNQDLELQEGWGDWSMWSQCSKTCGSGQKIRTRICDVGNCVGSKRSVKYCNEVYCPIDGGWGVWSSWGECSSTCGTRKRSRNRDCSNPSMKHNGKLCPGPTHDYQDCDVLDPCPIHGGWADWFEWSLCTKSCDSGLRSRNRSCSNPIPAFNGRDCIGNEISTQACSTNPCPINGEWTLWSAWSSCSTTCGESNQKRTRSCADPEPQFGGANCPGDSIETLICPTDSCPVVYPLCCDSKEYIGRLTSEAHCDCLCFRNRMNNFNWNPESKDCFCGTASCRNQCGFQYEGPLTRKETTCTEF